MDEIKAPSAWRTPVAIAFLLMIAVVFFPQVSITAWLWLPLVCAAWWQSQERFSLQQLMMLTAAESAALAWFIYWLGRPEL